MANFNIVTPAGVIKIQDWNSETVLIEFRNEFKTKIIGTGIISYDDIGTIQMLKSQAMILKTWPDGEMPIDCRIFHVTDEFTQVGYFITLGLIQE